MILGLVLRFVVEALVALVATSSAGYVERGRISVYWPGDGCRTGRVMACDRPNRRVRYTRGSWHVAVRDWRRVGCGTVLRICSEATGRCVRAPVLDSGPWGAYRGSLENARREGRYAVVTGSLPTGWRWRGHVDVSRAVWVALGRPRFLSRVRVYYPRGRR